MASAAEKTILGVSTSIHKEHHRPATCDPDYNTNARWGRFLDDRILVPKSSAADRVQEEPGTVARYGYGWTEAIDSDSLLRLNPSGLTIDRLREGLQSRPFKTVPYLGRGGGDADILSALWSGVEDRVQKACLPVHLPDRLTGMCRGPVVVESWRLGGAGTRAGMRRPVKGGPAMDGRAQNWAMPELPSPIPHASMRR